MNHSTFLHKPINYPFNRLALPFRLQWIPYSYWGNNCMIRVGGIIMGMEYEGLEYFNLEVHMRKWGLIVLLVCLAVMGAGCSNNDSDKQNNTETTKKDTTTKKETKETVTEQVSVEPGLGDTVDAFSKQYGENKGNTQIGRFKNDYLLPMFINNRAVDLTVQFEATEQKTRSMDEAKQIAAKLLPKDAKLEKEYTDTSDLPQKVMLYHSEALGKLFPDMEPVGSFVVIINYHDSNENEVFSINIGLGNTP